MQAHAEIFPNTLTLEMDFNKSIKTPKVSAQNLNFKLKLTAHQMSIYYANNKAIHCFFYNETISRAEPNEVISLLDYILSDIEDKLGKNDISLNGVTMHLESSKSANCFLH